MSKQVQVRVQSVQTTYFEVSPQRGQTLGNQIEQLIRSLAVDGHHANKIVIDLNPKQEPPDNEIDA